MQDNDLGFAAPLDGGGGVGVGVGVEWEGGVSGFHSLMRSSITLWDVRFRNRRCKGPQMLVYQNLILFLNLR